ncbi:MAG TPA: hypothetical protein VHP38_10475 [Ruminiclostridium sp.]|nr:hypothetical protein [Ruminiclostridium sp.]
MRIKKLLGLLISLSLLTASACSSTSDENSKEADLESKPIIKIDYTYNV